MLAVQASPFSCSVYRKILGGWPSASVKVSSRTGWKWLRTQSNAPPARGKLKKMSYSYPSIIVCTPPCQGSCRARVNTRDTTRHLGGRSYSETQWLATSCAHLYGLRLSAARVPMAQSQIAFISTSKRLQQDIKIITVIRDHGPDAPIS